MNVIDKRIFKMTSETLQQYLHFRRRGSKTKLKKGKGCKYDRNQMKKDTMNYDE